MLEELERRLAAILAADIAGYSALMGANEEATVRDLKAHQAVILPMIAKQGGRVIDTAGDGILAEFPSVVNAIECAVALQKVMAERNASIPTERQMSYRIGVNLGDVIHDGQRVYGDGVNIAARLESIAEPGGICISGEAFAQVQRKLQLRFVDIGEHQLKNITDPVRVYRIDTNQHVLGTARDPRGPARATRLLELGISQYFDGDFELSAETSRQVLRQYPDHGPTYRFLLAALGQLGRQAEGEALIKIAPPGYDYYARHRPPWFSPKDHEHMLEGMRKAGWSE